MSKINCPFKYEKCEGCGYTLVPVTNPLVFGLRLCTCCAIQERSRLKKEKTILRKYSSIRAAEAV